MAGAVNVSVVTVGRLVLNVRRRDGDAARLFFRSSVDLVIGLELAEILGDRRRQRRLAMVNVADRANVNVRLVALKLTLCHLNASYDRNKVDPANRFSAAV